MPDENSTTGYVYGPCLLTCDANYFLDEDSQLCGPDPAHGCCVPDQGNISTTCIILDLYTHEKYVAPAAPYTYCTAAQMNQQNPPQPSATATNTDTGTVSTVNTATHSIDSQHMQDSASKSITSQKDSMAASEEVISLGGNQAATMGALFCAEGANKAVENPQLSGQDLKNCQDNFRTANQTLAMQEKMGKQGGFTPDPAAMSQEGTKTTLDAFSKNFGIEGDEYMRRMLGAKGSMGEFSDMLKSKLSDDQINAAIAAADATKSQGEDPAKFAVSLGAKNNPGKPNTSLRDILKKKLSEKTEGRNTASAEDKSYSEKIQKIGDKEHLEPLGGDSIFSTNDENRELTIFDVVHIRYVKLTPGLHR